MLLESTQVFVNLMFGRKESKEGELFAYFPLNVCRASSNISE